MPVNGTYILEQDENNPCNWCYENNDINIVSVRAGGALFDPDPAIALGLKICAIKGYYPQFPDRTYIFASSYLVPEDGLADYFTAVKEPENGCVGDSNIPNDLTSCCCSPWMDIPPWTAGLGGTATIKELVDYNGDPLCFINFEAFAGFADDWLKTGPDLDADWDGDSDVDFEDLRRFVDKWLR
jgi:hypothetical protein